MSNAAEFCWVSEDGTLQSGSRAELVAAFRSGAIPTEHPIWKQDWNEWIPLADILAARAVESAGAPIPARAIVPAPIDPDATNEDLTQPLYHLRHRALVFPLTTPLPQPETEAAPPAILPVAPRMAHAAGGVSRTIPPRRPETPWRLPVIAGASFALTGAVVAATILIAASLESPHSSLRRGAVTGATLERRADVRPKSHGCRLGAGDSLLSERVAPAAAIHVASGSGGRALVGVTSTEKSGFGLTVGLAPLSVLDRELVVDREHLAGVIPGLGGAGARFSADRFTRGVPSSEPFSLGMTPAGFSRMGTDGSQRTIWPGQAAQIITRPEVVDAGAAGFLVAFRRGSDESANVRLGWLTRTGEAKSELGALQVSSGLVADPTVAVNESAFAAAYATRAGADATWTIELATAPLGALPSNSVPLRAADNALDRQHPSLAPLTGGRFLLGWVEGDKAHGRELRAQVVDSTLRPEGAPLTLAKTPRYVDDVVLHRAGDQVLVLFSERVERGWAHLRAATLDCQ